MLLTSDMRELFGLFETHQVQYVLVGGFAVNYYGYVRTTQDIDILVYPSPDNAIRIMHALGDFGFAGAGIPQQCFENAGTAVHLGQEPNRIDLLTNLEGIDNETIFSGAQRIKLDGTAVSIISFDHLIEAKQSSSRLKDRADASEMLKSRARERSRKT